MKIYSCGLVKKPYPNLLIAELGNVRAKNNPHALLRAMHKYDLDHKEQRQLLCRPKRVWKELLETATLYL